MNNTATASKIETRWDKSKRLEKAFPDFVEKLAFALNAGLPVGTSEFFGEIPLRDGVVLSCRLNGTDGKVEIGIGSLRDSRNVLHTVGDAMTYGERNGTADAQKFTISINVSAEGRAFSVLAADITRRLLPSARILWARIADRVRCSNDYAARCLNEAARFAQLLGVAPHQNDSTRAERNFFPPELPGVHCVTVADDNVSFKFSGSADLAAKILELIKAEAK